MPDMFFINSYPNVRVQQGVLQDCVIDLKKIVHIKINVNNMHICTFLMPTCWEKASIKY